MEPLIFYHGARRWHGSPSLQPSRAKRAEHGPGLYLTTSMETARRYAKGGGRVYQFIVDPELSWLQDKRIRFDDILSFLNALPKLRRSKKARIVEDISRYRARTNQMHTAAELPASVLVNLMVNHDALVGEVGPLLATFLVMNGIDASDAQYSGGSGNEDWVVLFNLRKILSWGPASAGAPWEAPRIGRSPR